MELGPHKSAERIRDSAKFLVTAVTVVGAVITGLGLAGNDIVADRLELALPALACTVVSISLAAWALVPAAGVADLNDLESVHDYWEGDIRSRGWKVRIAGILFAISLMLAVIPVIAEATGDQTAAIEATSLGGPKPTVKVITAAENLPKTGIATVEVRRQGRVLAQTRARVGEDRKIKSTLTAQLQRQGESLVAELSVHEGGRRVFYERLTTAR